MSRKALVVGIDNYLKCPLNACINDANAVASLLERNEDGTKNFDVRTIYDVENKAVLKQEIRKLFKGDSEVALFYFSGHGCNDENKGYLVTRMFQQDDYGLPMNELIEMAHKSKIKNKIIILDTCHSGSIGSSAFQSDVSNITDGLTVLTSCRTEETSVEDKEHGIFTSLLINGLKGGASDLLGNVTAGGLYAFIDRSLGPWDQRPSFKTNVSSFTVIRKTDPPIDLSILRSLKDIFSSPYECLDLDPSFEYTNDPNVEHEVIEPYAVEKNVKLFKQLQKLQSVGLVQPVGEDHMYFAAMNSKACKLTEVGKYYYMLSKEGRI